MLNFAEQTGSGAVMLVWSFPLVNDVLFNLYLTLSQSVSFSFNIFLHDNNFQRVQHTSTSIHWGYLLLGYQATSSGSS
jgi:hypothetical protein